jgi:predicted helicase
MSDADSSGPVTSRDAWAYNSSKEPLLANMASMIEIFNSEVECYRQAQPYSVDDFVVGDEIETDWSAGLEHEPERRATSQDGSLLSRDASCARIGLYHPLFYAMGLLRQGCQRETLTASEALADREPG